MARLNIALIMDGNRRWATAQGKAKLLGHEAGAETIERVLEWCKDIDAQSVTLYAFSTENFNRSKEELAYLFNLFRKYFEKLGKDERLMKDKVRIRFLGDITLFPKDIQDMCLNIEKKTEKNEKFLLQFCFGYGGRSEIVRAAKSLVAKGVKVEDITEARFAKELYTDIEPDVVVRTGGAMRQSNFLPWQSTYSEWFYIDTFWPDLERKELDAILEEFKGRQRRFGK